ncbi:hypothetical protein TUBRATIS_21380 [Tubulinosema ratisbonensis]|uniref:Uncharacterized protein n=1 Tax=Tubulinosema ratisbonensis TaxID=291195 RepID=A0A437AJW7_9MICR|nr:hypothetical protein TUBRATIS_21380 [Tubulinosema ratisbonensis]
MNMFIVLFRIRTIFSCYDEGFEELSRIVNEYDINLFDLNIDITNQNEQRFTSSEQNMVENNQIGSNILELKSQTSNLEQKRLDIRNGARFDQNTALNISNNTKLQETGNNYQSKMRIYKLENNYTSGSYDSTITCSNEGLDMSMHVVNSVSKVTSDFNLVTYKSLNCKTFRRKPQIVQDKELYKKDKKGSKKENPNSLLQTNFCSESNVVNKKNLGDGSFNNYSINTLKRKRNNKDQLDKSKEREQRRKEAKALRNNYYYVEVKRKRAFKDEIVDSGLGEYSFKDIKGPKMKTFLYENKLDKTKKINLNLFKEINVSKIIFDVENESTIIFNKIFSYLTSKNFPVKHFLLENEECEEDLQTITNFFNQYILNSNLREIFMKEQDKLNFKFVFKKCSKNKTIGIAKKFNSILKEYVLEVKKVCNKNISDYFRRLNLYFYTKNNNILQKKLIWFLEKFLETPRMKIITYLFPEIHVFVDDLKAKRDLKHFYKKFYLFISLLGFKVCLLSENLKYVFESNKLNPNFVFTDSNFINFFVFEIRCFMCCCGFTLLKEKTAINFLLYKTFISFIRISNIDVLKGTKFDDYISYENFRDSDLFINIGSKKIKISKDNKNDPCCYFIKRLSKTDFDNFLQLKMRSRKKLCLKEETKILQYYENINFDMKVQEITTKIFNYFNEIN